MTRWKKDAKEFLASLSKSKNLDGSQSYVCRIPKPIVEKLGVPSKIKFTINGKTITVKGGEK